MRMRDMITTVAMVSVFAYGAFSMWRDFRGTSAYQLVAMLPFPTVNDVTGMICR